MQIENENSIGTGILKSYRWRVIAPMMLVMYMFAYLDRTNISFALSGIEESFAVTSSVSGFITGIFFIGYMILQVPAGHLASHKSAKRNILILGILLGVFSSLQGFANNITIFIIMRFLLGVAEGGMLPTMYVLVNNWFPARERGRATSTFMLYQALAPLVMSPVSGYMVASLNWAELPGWRWMFILQGIPAVIFAIVFYIVVPDHPKWATSKKFSEQERLYLLAELDREAKEEKVVKEKTYWKAALNSSFILTTLAWLGMVIGNYGIFMWMPVIIEKTSSLGYTAIGFISMLPWIAATVGMIAVGIINDKWRNRKGLLAILQTMSGVSILLLLVVSTVNFWLTILFLTIAVTGAVSASAVYLSSLSDLIPSGLLGGLTGVFSAVGNLGGFIGPVVVGALMSKASQTGGSELNGGMGFIAIVYFIAAILILFVKSQKKKDMGKEYKVTAKEG
ncbi:MFS transporter [Peribacillus frigoritolerans]|uniref:MFS transporter n=1 Tax=Peribacillus frigoritolerans TaxID=450367 RepID=UPI0035188F46